MSFLRNILPYAYLPLSIFNAMRRSLSGADRQGRLRVLLCHDIAPEKIETFIKMIEWLSKRWRFIGAQEFSEIIAGKRNISDDCLLLSFDDGFYSDRLVAEQVLNPMGIPALFFIISEFAALHKREEQIRFIKKNLYPASSGEAYPENINELKNMSFEDIKYLIDTGHTIGAHTGTHARLSMLKTHEALIKEIISSADSLEARLNIKIEHFSYSFGNLWSFSQEALKVARSRFPYIYTGMRGDNLVHGNPWAIRRDTIAVNDSLGLVGAFLEGAVDFRYKRDLKTYESWGGFQTPEAKQACPL